eukprot:2651134-Rhodomonas_salina.2
MVRSCAMCVLWRSIRSRPSASPRFSTHFAEEDDDDDDDDEEDDDGDDDDNDDGDDDDDDEERPVSFNAQCNMSSSVFECRCAM